MSLSFSDPTPGHCHFRLLWQPGIEGHEGALAVPFVLALLSTLEARRHDDVGVSYADTTNPLIPFHRGSPVGSGYATHQALCSWLTVPNISMAFGPDAHRYLGT